MRFRQYALAGLAVAIAGTLVAVGQSASFGTLKPPGLKGETLISTKGTGGSTAKCQGKSGSFSFKVTGQAEGPYQGRFTETGIVTLSKYRITKFTSSVRITSKNAKITLTESLAKPARDEAFCLPWYGFAGLKGRFRASGTVAGHAWKDNGTTVLAFTGGAAKASFIRQLLS